jgi:hypothetical protein
MQEYKKLNFTPAHANLNRVDHDNNTFFLS